MSLRLVTYRGDDGGWRPGLLDDAGVRDIAAVAAAAGLSLDCSSNRRVLEAGPGALDELAGNADRVEATALAAVTLGPPVPDPQKVICLGLNYRDHAEETGAEPPSAPILFAKYPSSLIGPGAPIVRPAVSDQVDYEAELAVVVGRRCRLVAEEDAIAHLAGAMPFNDVSARDLQFQTSQWTAGKALDTFAPCGPALVTLDAVGDLQSLRIRARVNGETLQDGTTADMIFGVAETIAHLSRLMTLEPGDIVATGTPAGVGFTRDPQVLLRDGDRVEVEIEGLGVLENPVVDA
jgi:2-keto-4-pentenoate hydratase/2-oxohepta-3-ene-1,7-dioic acid hydratase in catechol pathway